MNILIVLQITSLTLGVFSALIYLLPIIIVPRLHKTNNIYTVNLCLAVVFCCLYWLAFIVMMEYYLVVFLDSRICVLMHYLQMSSAIQIPLALIGISTNRFCTIVYPRKAIFTKKKCVIIWIAIQWMSGFILSLPRIVVNTEFCSSQQWRGIYTLIMIVVVPSAAYAVINLLLFKYVRSSTTRVHTTNKQEQPINRRDIHLLRHVIVIFCIFIGGWGPIFTYVAIVSTFELASIVFAVLFLLAILSVFCVIIDLFLYNHDLRKYFREKIFLQQ